MLSRQIFLDDRGVFEPILNTNDLIRSLGFKIVQVNTSLSRYGVMRGLHQQRQPMEQAKMVVVLHGEILDFFVSTNEEDDDYGVLHCLRMNEESDMLYLPANYAHGFLTLSDTARLLYAVNSEYSPEHEITYAAHDYLGELSDKLGSDMPKDIIQSDKDRLAESLR